MLPSASDIFGLKPVRLVLISHLSLVELRALSLFDFFSESFEKRTVFDVTDVMQVLAGDGTCMKTFALGLCFVLALLLDLASLL